MRRLQEKDKEIEQRIKKTGILCVDNDKGKETSSKPQNNIIKNYVRSTVNILIRYKGETLTQTKWN